MQIYNLPVTWQQHNLPGLPDTVACHPPDDTHLQSLTVIKSSLHLHLCSSFLVCQIIFCSWSVCLPGIFLDWFPSSDSSWIWPVATLITSCLLEFVNYFCFLVSLFWSLRKTGQCAAWFLSSLHLGPTVFHHFRPNSLKCYRIIHPTRTQQGRKPLACTKACGLERVTC